MIDEKQLANDLFESFNKHDLNLLESLLNEGVKHSAQGSAFGAEMAGRKEYIEHMNGVLSNFKSINFSPYRIHYDPTVKTLAIEWQGDFVTINDVAYSSDGVFVMEITDGKISWVREYFDTEKTQQAMSNN